MSEIVRLTPDDWQELKSIRLRAVQAEPAAFGRTLEEESAKSEEVWRKQLAESSYYVARVDGQTVGMVCWVPEHGEKVKHFARIYGVYVDAAARGTGVGRALMEAILKDLSSVPGLVKARLYVAVSQTAAQALYEKLGFKKVGLLEKELFVDGEYVDTNIMEKFFA